MSTSKLRVIVGYGSTLEEAIAIAIRQYNELDARVIYHDRDIIINDDSVKVLIWFTQEQVIVEETNDFIGSRGIDPNDPNWREKFQQS